MKLSTSKFIHLTLTAEEALDLLGVIGGSPAAKLCDVRGDAPSIYELWQELEDALDV